MAQPLPDAQVIAIRREREAGERLSDIATRHKLSVGAVSHIVKGKRYKHLPILAGHDLRHDTRLVQDDDAPRIIRRRWADGEPVNVIAAELGISETTVKRYVDLCEESGPEWQRVMPDTGAAYRDALLAIAKLDGKAGELARKTLGI